MLLTTSSLFIIVSKFALKNNLFLLGNSVSCPNSLKRLSEEVHQKRQMSPFGKEIYHGFNHQI